MNRLLYQLNRVSKTSLGRRFFRIETISLILLCSIILGVFMPTIIKVNRLSDRHAHTSIRQTINGQLDIFRANHGYTPTEMTVSDWRVPDSEYALHHYFPDGVPKHCPMGGRWEIDLGTGYLSPHLSHE